MALGLIGKKIGMTRVFTPVGESVPVTVVHVQPNRITALKAADKHGYTAVQITTGTRRTHKMTKAELGVFKSAGIEPGNGLWEFRVAPQIVDNYKIGDELTVSLFTENAMVDVTGTSLGKGFAGTIKRHNFAGQDASHGNSLSHRKPGSIGQNQTPGHVFKGKKMAGHLGVDRRTVQNLPVTQIDAEKGLLFIQGAVPGYEGGFVMVRPAVKKPLVV